MRKWYTKAEVWCWKNLRCFKGSFIFFKGYGICQPGIHDGTLYFHPNITSLGSVFSKLFDSMLEPFGIGYFMGCPLRHLRLGFSKAWLTVRNRRPKAKPRPHPRLRSLEKEMFGKKIRNNPTAVGKSVSLIWFHQLSIINFRYHCKRFPSVTCASWAPSIMWWEHPIPFAWLFRAFLSDTDIPTIKQSYKDALLPKPFCQAMVPMPKGANWALSLRVRVYYLTPLWTWLAGVLLMWKLQLKLQGL